MNIIDKNRVNEIIGAVTERVDSGTKEATRMKKFEMGFEIAKELHDVGGYTDMEYIDFMKKLLKQIGFNN